MDGSLYAGIGDWMDPDLNQGPAAQVLRLESPNGTWVEDQNFLQTATAKKNGNDLYQAVAAMGAAHFDHDLNKNPITPVDVLMAGFWNYPHRGVASGSENGHHRRSRSARNVDNKRSRRPAGYRSGQLRAFTSNTDSVTGVEMAFAGSDNGYGIFSGGFNAGANAIQWGAAGEPGSAPPCGASGVACRTMSFAACGGKLYASIYDAIAVRTDGANPSWQIFYQYSGTLNSASSGFRGLTCVPNLNGAGSMLIAALEGPGDIYDIPLDGSQPTIELHTINFVSSQLGTWTGYTIDAYNDMTLYPNSGTKNCPDYLIGLYNYAGGYPGSYEGLYPNPSFLIRHCNGSYDFQTIVAPSITPAPTPIVTRTLAVSQFPGDPAGTIYAGGFDAHSQPAHNTDWIYRGTPN